MNISSAMLPNSASPAGVLPSTRTKKQDGHDAKMDAGTDGGQTVDKNNPLDLLKERLAKENAPSALDKLHIDLAKNALESLSRIARAWQDTHHVMANPLAKNIQLPDKTPDSKELADASNDAKSEKVDESKASHTNGDARTLDYSIIPMVNFEHNVSSSYKARYDSQTGQAIQEFAYSNTYSFSFKGRITDQNGKSYHIEANVTLSHSLYSKVVGGAESLDPKTLQRIQDGNPLELSYEGDGKDVDNLNLFLDDAGASKQISENPFFSDMIDKAFGEGLGSLLDGLRIFNQNLAFDSKHNPFGTNPSLNEHKDSANQTLSPNIQQLLGIGEQGIGIVAFSSMQRFFYAQSHDGNGHFSYASFMHNVFYAQNQTSLEVLLEKQNNKEQQATAKDVKKALQTYNNTHDNPKDNTTATSSANSLQAALQSQNFI